MWCSEQQQQSSTLMKKEKKQQSSDGDKDNKQEALVLTGAVGFAFLFAFAFVLPWTELGFLLFAFATFLLLSYVFAVEPARLERHKVSCVFLFLYSSTGFHSIGSLL